MTILEILKSEVPALATKEMAELVERELVTDKKRVVRLAAKCARKLVVAKPGEIVKGGSA